MGEDDGCFAREEGQGRGDVGGHGGLGSVRTAFVVGGGVCSVEADEEACVERPWRGGGRYAETKGD